MRAINTLTVAVISIVPNTELSLVNDSSSSNTISADAGNYKLIINFNDNIMYTVAQNVTHFINITNFPC